ncbi:MAG: NAD(P)/FAD-dependent oxidoreductase [Acidimicrobiales bacterium]
MEVSTRRGEGPQGSPTGDVPGVAEQSLWGAGAGLLGGLVVGSLMGRQAMMGGSPGGGAGGLGVFLASAATTGALLGVVVGYRPRGFAASVSGGLLLGLLAWIVWSLTLEPLVRGEGPSWSAAAAGETFDRLVGYVLHGGLTGACFYGLVLRRVRARPAGPTPTEPPAPRVVIVGGGFAGVSAARRFEQLVARGHELDVTLVSQSNYLLFTPMLAEVASSALEAQHISAPVRASCPLTRFRKGVVEGIDPARRVLHLSSGPATTEAVPYDHLVLALGGVPHFLGLPGVEEHAFSLKTLEDATRLRNHVLGLLERADGESDATERGRQLTFVVAGGGFAGTEMVAELFDLVHGVLGYYPGLGPGEPRFVLVHSGGRILPEISAELADYALSKLRGRGIEFRLGTRVAGASADAVLLQGGDTLATHTLVWTAGSRPHPLLESVPGEKGRGGSLLVEATLEVRGLERVWAVGDCAQIPDPERDGAPYPPTAQHALREGRAVADNVAAVLRGGAPAPFRFRSIGTLVALGHRTAVAEVRGRRFSGLAAWLLWRGVYLAKLPGLEKKLRVLIDWSIDLAFPRDIVVTAGPPTPKPQRSVVGPPGVKP